MALGSPRARQLPAMAEFKPYGHLTWAGALGPRGVCLLCQEKGDGPCRDPGQQCDCRGSVRSPGLALGLRDQHSPEHSAPLRRGVAGPCLVQGAPGVH